jgi:hypothetical protein
MNFNYNERVKKYINDKSRKRDHKAYEFKIKYLLNYD